MERQVRKIRPTRRSVSGMYAFRGETAIAFESTLERDFLIRQEYFKSVLDVIPQPTQVTFAVKRRAYTYTPDFMVYYRLGRRGYGDYPKPLLVEVKPEAEWRAHWREWLPKWKAARRYSREYGCEFHIHDESRIRDQALANIRFLERYKRMEFAVEESRWILKNLGEMGASSFDYLVARHFMGEFRRATGIAHLWHLLATRQLDCDIHKPFSPNTVLWIATDE